MSDDILASGGSNAALPLVSARPGKALTLGDVSCQSIPGVVGVWSASKAIRGFRFMKWPGSAVCLCGHSWLLHELGMGSCGSNTDINPKCRCDTFRPASRADQRSAVDKVQGLTPATPTEAKTK